METTTTRNEKRPLPPETPGMDVHPDSPLFPWIVRLAPLSLCGFPLHVRGETGSGKERIARLFHLLSPRAAGPFVAVNCGAIPKGTAESALFGHRRGAFTGAAADHRGYLEQADGGTLFLDEIGEMPPEVQVLLLRALQEREIVPVGGERPRPVSFALVSATHRNLRELVARGLFREDLYHRICALTIDIPPLSERPMDLPRLALALWKERHAAAGPFPLDAAELAGLCFRRWSGNVRELDNWLCRRAWARRWDLSPAEEWSVAEEPSPAPARERAPETPRALSGSPPSVAELRRRSRAAKGEEAFEALARAGGNKCAAAKALRIPRSTLDYRLKAFVTAPAGVPAP